MMRIVVLAVLSLLAGCSSLQAKKDSFAPGKILVLPPRDVVQDGAPHEKGKGSGKMLQDMLVTRLRATAFPVLETDNLAFSHEQPATKDAAIEEGRRLGADYSLQLVLGEFRDAAPMTFRSDTVTLSQGILYATATGNEVWVLTAPYEQNKTNIGGYRSLLESIAAAVVQSITR